MFVGDYCGAAVTTGSQNTFIGQSCGSAITTGSKNSILGQYNGNQGGLDIRTASNYIVLSDGDGNPRGIFDNSGNFFVGQTTGSSKFNLTTVSGGSAITITDGTASGLAWQMGPRVGTGTLTDFGFYNATGSVFLGRMTSAGVWYQGNNSASWSITSDERIKENINTLNNGLSIITALRPVEFDYKISKKHDIGFIAQEYQKILPEQINENEPTNETKEFIDDGKLLSISSNLVPYLVSAIQELNAKVDAQAVEIATLKAK